MGDTEKLAGALAKRLASHEVSNDAIAKLVREIGPIGKFPIDIGICTLGICVDYYIDRGELTDLFEKLGRNAALGPVRVFPKGIILPEGFLVQVEHTLDRRA